MSITLIDRAKKYTAHKYLGQNFLVSEDYLEQIADSLSPNIQNVLEIGPGLGFLTEKLLARGLNVWAVDLDEVALNKISKHSNLTKIHQDILSFDFQVLPKPFSVVGNLPFHIGGQILTGITGELDTADWKIEGIKEMVLMFQLEVAERIAAQPKNKAYNQLSLLMEAKTHREFICKVPAEYFYPKPKVHAGVVRLTPCQNPVLSDIPEETRLQLYKIIRAAFQMRRKTIRNSVSKVLSEEQIIRAGVNPKLRAEELTLADFCALAKETRII